MDERRHAEWTATATHPWGATPLPGAQVSLWEVGVVRWQKVHMSSDNDISKLHGPMQYDTGAFFFGN